MPTYTTDYVPPVNNAVTATQSPVSAQNAVDPLKSFAIEGAHVAMAIIGAAASTMVLIPFLDTGKNPTISKLATIWGVVFLIALGVLTYMGLQV